MRIASALVGGISVVMLAVLLREVSDMVGAFAVGAVGAVLLAGTLGLAGERDRPAMSVGAGLLVLPAGAGLVGSVLVALVLLVEELFPVEEEALISVAWLNIIGHVGVVVGCSLVVLGLAVAVRPVVGEDTLFRGLRVAFAAWAVLAVTALAFLLITLGTGATPDTTVVPPVTAAVGALLAPVVVVASALPRPVAGVVLVAVTVLAVAAVGRLLRRLPATPLGSPTSYLAGAVAGGTLATISVITAAEWAYDRVVSELLRRFPEAVESDIQEVSTTASTSFGESTVVLLAALLCVGVTGITLFLLRVGVGRGALAGESVGSTLASMGVFVATVFAGVLGGPTWLVVGGILASLVVWDAGRFGRRLTAEVGSISGRRVELAHLGGTLLVGLVGTAVALLVVSWVPADPGVPTATDLLALCSVVVGLLSLVLALR